LPYLNDTTIELSPYALILAEPSSIKNTS